MLGTKKALEEGGHHPPHWGAAWRHSQRVVRLAQLEGSVKWRMWFHLTFPGCCVPSITTAFFYLLDSNLPEGWSESMEEGGFNKYLHLFQKKGKADHSNSSQVYTTQGVRHKFTCGKQAIHRCNPRKTCVIKP